MFTSTTWWSGPMSCRVSRTISWSRTPALVPAAMITTSRIEPSSIAPSIAARTSGHCRLETASMSIPGNASVRPGAATYIIESPNPETSSPLRSEEHTSDLQSPARRSSELDLLVAHARVGAGGDDHHVPDRTVVDSALDRGADVRPLPVGDRVDVHTGKRVGQAGSGDIHHRVAEPGDLPPAGQTGGTALAALTVLGVVAVVAVVTVVTVVGAGGVGGIVLVRPAISLLLTGRLVGRFLPCTVRGGLVAAVGPGLTAAGARLRVAGRSTGALVGGGSTDQTGGLVHGDLHLRAFRCGGERHGEQH